MNSLIGLWPPILEFGQQYGLPAGKKRAILREYLQTKILGLIYRQKISRQLFFTGGTALRLLYNLDRFSEDLDFDLGEINSAQVKKLLAQIAIQLKRENISVKLYHNITSKRSYFELRFPDLLAALKLSPNTEEKLAVKLDFEKFWIGHQPTPVILERYGLLATVVTLPLDQILVQKLFAYPHRRQTLPRDLYDLVWLIAQKARPDPLFLKKNHLSGQIIAQAQKKFAAEKNHFKTLK
ncbi:MAG: nucleotidyl transferase AbiEii/AbiGii toxin family protein, partial [bacterium]|nr:nucleotidyl transferase AbiEii/AbiGii toxin family protein [bacterium]